jgi:predicted NAD/FAD-binding protein
VWRTVRGGSREYARKLMAPLEAAGRIRLHAPVRQIRRDETGVTLRTAAGDELRVDHVFLACHSDQALAMLEDPSPAEREVLGAFPYQENHAVLHTDSSVLPRRELARAAWNYHLLDPPRERVALTYDMNVLQSIDSPRRFLVTLNREDDIAPATILGRYTYHHPVYTPAAVAAQARRAEVSGTRRTYYCGAYWRYGFHEDGVVSAIWALRDFAAATGAPAPAPPLLEPTRRSRK